MDESSDSVMITDWDGRIVWVNRTFSGVTGYSAADSIGKNPRLLKSGFNSPTLYEDLWRTIKSGKEWRGTIYNKKKSGRLYLEKESIIPIRSAEGEQTIFVSVRKVLTEIGPEGSLLTPQMRVVDSLLEGVVFASKELVITLWNKGAERIYGWTAEEVVGKRITEVFLHDLSVAQLRERARRVDENGVINELVYARRKNGRGILVQRNVTPRRGPDDRVDGFIGLHKVVAGDERITPKVSGKRSLLISVLDSVSEGVLLIDDEKRIFKCNDPAGRFLMISPMDIRGRKLLDLPFWVRELSFKWDEMIRRALVSDTLVRSEDTVMIAGALRTIRSTSFPIVDSNGRNGRAGVVFEEMKPDLSLNARSGGFDGLVELGKMAAGLSHEIKTPLSSIKMNLDFLDDVADLSPSRKRLLAIVRKEVGRLSEMIDEVLQLASPAGEKNGPAKVSKIVDDLEILFTPLLAKKNITLHKNVEDTEIIADAMRLESAFSQLLENAIDAVDAGGRIEFFSETDRANGKFSVFIADNGSGISNPEEIFRPFFSTKKKGTGLGLAVAREILRKSGGDIELVSGEPGNTKFRVSFEI